MARLVPCWCWDFGCASSCELEPLGRPPRRLDIEGKEHFEVSSTGGDGGG